MNSGCVASTGFRACECWLSGLRVLAFGVASAVFRGCAYIREWLCVYTRRPLCMYAQTFMHVRVDVS